MPGPLRAVLEAERRGDLEGVPARVDLVVAAVGEADLAVDQRVAGEDAAAHRLADALLDRGDELLGDDAADDVVLEDEARAALGRLDVDDARGRTGRGRRSAWRTCSRTPTFFGDGSRGRRPRACRRWPRP